MSNVIKPPYKDWREAAQATIQLWEVIVDILRQNPQVACGSTLYIKGYAIQKLGLNVDDSDLLCLHHCCPLCVYRQQISDTCKNCPLYFCLDLERSYFNFTIAISNSNYSNALKAAQQVIIDLQNYLNDTE